MITGRTTIFRQLIFNIAIPTLLALLVFSAINFQRTRSILSSGTAEKNKLLANEVTKILKFQDMAINLIDVQLNNRLKELNSLLVNKYFANTSNLDKVDLFTIAYEIGMDTINEAIYIISSDGIVINTTFRQDLGKDLYSLGENMKKYLQNMQQSGEFFGERFAIEDATKRPKKYTYQATKDKKYIIELGAYSKQVDDIVQAIEITKSEIKSETRGIIDLELFLWADFAFSLNKDYLKVDQDRILPKVFQDRDTIEFVDRVGDRWYNYNYIYMERFASEDVVGASFYQGSVIRIISDRTEQMELFRKEAFRFIFIFLITMLALSAVIYRKTKVITRPIKKLVENVDRITNGDLRERAEVSGNNEITRLTEKFNMMIAQLESYYYELEEKVKERTLRIEKQKEEIESQRDALALKNMQLNEAYNEIEEQKKHIMDSIYYARRIQTAILPSFAHLDKLLKSYFILYLPKDIVSGDFYWMHDADDLVMLAAVDCTGHGVPGAFMSIVGFNQLNFAVNVQKARKASDILNELNRGVIQTLNENTGETSIKDGMDMTICVFDLQNKKMDFAGANNPILLVRDGKMKKYKGDRFPIGAYIENQKQEFTNNEIHLADGDMIYMFSDGYADQFGGPESKKFFTKRFEQLLLDIHGKPLDEQKEILQITLYDWMGDNNQVDDILVIGVRI